MANITIITSTNNIDLNYNDIITPKGDKRGSWRKEDMSIKLYNNFIDIDIIGQKTINVSHNGNSVDVPTYQIDNIDGIVPESLNELYDLLQNIFIDKKSDSYSYINKFGRNYDIDKATTPEVIWAKGGLYTPPTTARIHNISSTSNNDSGVLKYNGTISTLVVEDNGNLVITDLTATFIGDGVSSGDKFIDITKNDHTLIYSVDSETQITIQPLHDSTIPFVGDIFKIISSTSTGAGVLHIFGLDNNCDEQSEFVILNGTTTVTTALSYLRINKCHTDLTGGAHHNVGDIDVVAQTDGTSTAFIRATDGQTLQAFYTIPNKKTGKVTSVNISSHREGSTSNAMISVSLRGTKFIPQGTIGIVEDTISVSLVGSSFAQKEYNPEKVFKQRTDIWLQVDYTTDNGMDVSGGFDVLLTDN